MSILLLKKNEEHAPALCKSMELNRTEPNWTCIHLYKYTLPTLTFQHKIHLHKTHAIQLNKPIFSELYNIRIMQNDKQSNNLM